MSTDYYSVLGVEKTADKAEIKAAFRKLAHQHHPDKGGEEEKFKEINAAYQVLGNEEKRAQYDQFGEQAFQNGGGGGQGFGGFGGFQGAQGFGGFEDFGDVFASMFGQARTQQARRRANVAMDIEVSFKESALGVEKEIEVPKFDVDEHERQKIRVDIPAGVESGMRIRLRGRGRKIEGTEEYGDLYLEMHVKRDPRFEREGEHIFSVKQVGFTQAALGDEVEIETVEGKVKLKIPAGTQSSEKLRLRGKGVQVGRRRGDHYVIVQVMTPKKLSRKEKQTLEELNLTA
jgi:molecular chaperone DnaJ